MSDSRPPDDPRKPDEPQGLGSELRHELEEVVEKFEEQIEQVVESVPEPVRWTIGKILMLIGLGIAGLIVLAVVTAVLYVANRTEWAAQELTLIVNQTLATRSDAELSIRDIKGNPLSGVRVIEPRIRYRDGTGPDLLSAPSLTLHYSAWEFMTGKRTAIEVDIDRPIIRLTRGPDGKLRVPTWNPGPPNKSKRPGFDFVVRLKDGQVLMPEADQNVRGLQLDATAATGKPTRVVVRRLSWDEGPYGSILRRFNGDLSVSDSVHIRIGDLDSPGLALSGRADWHRVRGVKVVRAQIRRVRWSRLAEVFKNKTLDVPGEGRFAIDARGDGARWYGSIQAAGVWNDLPLDARGRFNWNDGQLAIEPLTGRSPAGELDGRVNWSKAGWEVGGNARHADPAHWKAIGITGWPAGDLNGRFRYRVDTRARPQARLSAQLEGTEWAGWRADSGGVIVDFPAVGPDSFKVRAFRRGGEMTLNGSASDGVWGGPYGLRRFPLDEWPDGRASGLVGTLASGRGTVLGRNGGLEVTGTLDGESTTWFGARMNQWRLDDVQGRLLPTPDLTADVRLGDVTFLGVHFDSAAAPIHLGDGTLDFGGLRAWATDTLVTMDARAAWDESGWSIAAQRADLQSSKFHWIAQPPMLLSGDPRGVRFDRLVASDGEAQVAIEGRWASPGGSYDWTARMQRLDLSRLGLPDTLRLSGTADGTLRVTGVSGTPRWELAAGSSRPGAQGHHADSLWVDLAGSPGRLEVRNARFLLAGGSAGGSGRIEDMERDWPDTLTAEGVLAWIERAGRWQGTFRADELPLDDLDQLAPAASDWSGRVSGTLTVGGRPSRPELRAELDASPIGWRGVRIESAVARATYRDERLNVEELKMSRQGIESRASGEMPLRLALGAKIEVPE